MSIFWNREGELGRLKEASGRPGFGFVTGRRRIGKTALLLEACRRLGGLYHQAVEGTPEQQIMHLAEEWGESLGLLRDIRPRNWAEFFRLLSRERLPPLLVFDEFPYWVAGDPALPSILQKWADHELPRRKTLLVVSGSSQAMLFSQFLRQGAPLYGRARLHIAVAPLSYGWFCRAMGHDPGDPDSFLRFSLVGGVPHYWKLMERGAPEDQAHRLYFEPAALLADEPLHLLRDEGVGGATPKAILDLVGRGVSRPSELAARLGMPQGNLSRPLALLLELGLLERELPFGESLRSTKKVLYRIPDPALAFYYGAFLPFRRRWPAMSRKERRRLLDRHASRIWEAFCRSAFPGSGRYWSKELEIDLIAAGPGDRPALVAECKWTRADPKRKQGIRHALEEKLSRTPLPRLGKARLRVFTQEDLPELARRGKAAH